jgi:hypothetical protein
MILPSAASIVILASNYNPSIVSKEWLYQKGIFTDTIKNFVHTPVFALVESKDFSLTVDEHMLQLTIKNVTEDNFNTSFGIVERFVDILPETPYTALGLNYHYTFPGERCDLRTILSPKNAKLREMFSQNYELGATLVFEFEKFVVNFTISPSVRESKQIRMGFNFHSDAANSGEVKERLSMHIRTLEKAETIVRGLLKNG